MFVVVHLLNLQFLVLLAEDFHLLDFLVSGIYAGIFLLGREYGLGSSRLSGTVYMV